MEVHSFVIELYVAPSGKQPFLEWLDSLKDARAVAKIKARLDRVEEGNLGDYKYVGGGVFELRLHFSPGYRIYFGLRGEIIVLLLLGGDKGTQSRDILKARKYWENYASQKDENG